MSKGHWRPFYIVVDQRNWKDIENVMIFINVVNTISYVIIIKVKDFKEIIQKQEA